MSTETQATHGEATTDSAHGAGSTAEAQGAPAQTVSIEDFSALQAKLETVIGENKTYRDDRRESKAAQSRLLEEQGQFKALSEARAEEITGLQTQIGELGGLRDDANSWREYQSAEAERIEVRAQALSEDERADLLAIPNLGARGRMLDRLTGSTKSAPAEHPRTGAPSSAPSRSDVPYGQMSNDEKAQARKSIRSAAGGARKSLFGL